jgi:hypothetical protein
MVAGGEIVRRQVTADPHDRDDRFDAAGDSRIRKLGAWNGVGRAQ